MVVAETVALTRNQVVGFELRAKDVGHDAARCVLNVLGIELHAKDGFFLPEGAPHQDQNLSAEPVSFLFGIAPRYLPTSA